MSSKRAVVGVDLGGTSIAAAVVDDAKGKILGEAKSKTEAAEGADAVVKRLAQTIERALDSSGLKKKHIAGVGVGVPGPLDIKTGTVVRCPNLGPSWDHYPLGERLQQLLSFGVTLENDVNVGAVGEYTFGAGRGSRDMLAIFVGTGIGGGIILDGKLHGGARGSAGEVGHMVILDGGPLCGCGERGHAEALASRTAIEREIREAIAAGRESIIPELLRAANRTTISAGILGDAYDAEDGVTLEAVQRAQYYLGVLIAACVNLLDPELVVVGGGVLERMGEGYLTPVRSVAVQQLINKSDVDPQKLIVRAALGDYSGAMGAAVLARQRLG